MRFPILLPILAALLVLPVALPAQRPTDSSSLLSEAVPDGGSGTVVSPANHKPVLSYPAFSRLAISGGVSLLGIQAQLATNLNSHLNLRGTGSFDNYTANNLPSNGFYIDTKIELASAGASVDYYPWAGHGFRLSPGVLFHNGNDVTGTFVAWVGSSFELNGYTYYVSGSDPVRGNGTVGLHSQNPAFTMTTGWGNMIPRQGGHLSFPVEVGAAFTGQPTVNVALTSGEVCDAQGQNCVDVATDPDVQSNLQAEVAKYKKDLEPLKVYPIISFGVAYSFRVRPEAGH